MPANSGGQKYINSRAAQEAIRGQPLSERTFACGQSRNTVTTQRGRQQQQQLDDDANAAMLSANANTQQQQQWGDEEGEGDRRNEGGKVESEWISVGAAKTPTQGGGRSIAPYPHTLIVSMSAREQDRPDSVGNFDLRFALKDMI
ncbi:hypothetical protein M5D96_000197 [Drosophila gunungcola]|uniref:Uncharacterized protein n=1 Tax=Drosophila gunungcola TaxID=103775 RepID=A0A9P9YWG4_9MUSC|nr:hypothetical protein M5D96_000197 [Drosophila gunungcola]